MKRKDIINTLCGVACIAGGLTACTNDLNVTPINPQQTMEYNQDAVFNKIYASFCLTGQTGPAGNGDVPGDEGQSEFFRMMWYLNEFTTDEAHWVWATDAGVPDLLHNNYGESNAFSSGMYYRLYFTITLCNFFLEQATGNDAATLMQRAEVRFIRALNYMYVMDLYGNAAFTTRVSAELPIRYTRKEYFDFIETELKEIENDMAMPGGNSYGRVDRVAAWLILSRLYLNAEVYTGNARWEDAMGYAEKVIKNGYYRLNETGATNPVTGEVYSPYQMLFLADNKETDARYEAILPVINDGVNTNSYGGMNFLVLSTYSSVMNNYVPSGTDTSWGKGTRVRSSLVSRFFEEDAPQTTSIQVMTDAANDDRALFYSEGYSQRIENEGDINAGFSCVKFRNVRSDGQPNRVITFVNTDLFLLRMAEAYLTYAEASTRLNGPNEDAASKINAVRTRANCRTNSVYSLNEIRDEWSREFWFEGRRRMDLIRFGCYGGQSNYRWEWMGGTLEGTPFDAYMNIFALPANELENNLNLKQNEGY